MSNKTSDKNVGSIEEDIKNLEKYIELVIDKNYCECNELNVICYGKYADGSKNVASSIKNILKDYARQKQINEEHQKINGELREKVKELEKESKILEFQNKQIENYAEELKKYNKTVSDRIVEYKKNSIPEQAVIDKINEYDKKMEEYAGHPHWVVTDRIVMNVLQELLEGERK